MSVGTALTLAEPEAAVGDTTYFCVVDAEGNAVSGIQSLNSGFGSGVTAGDTGILLNNRMAYWHLTAGHANRLVPGKRVRHTMNAPMVFKDNKLWAVEGTPGADNQVQINLQVLTSMMDLNADPHEGPRAAFAAAQRWRRRADHPLNDPFTTRACRAAVRSAEAMVADFAAHGYDMSNLEPR